MEETQFYLHDLGAWVPIRPRPLMSSNFEIDTLIETHPGHYWLFRGLFPYELPMHQIPWGLYLSNNGREVYWGTRALTCYPREYIRTVASEQFDFNILNDIKTNSKNFIPRPNSTTLLQYEHHDDESEIVRYIKDHINPMNKDLSYIMNELKWDQSKAYNLHYSLKKKRHITMRYAMYWFRLIGVYATLNFEHRGLDWARKNGVQLDFEIV